MKKYFSRISAVVATLLVFTGSQGYADSISFSTLQRDVSQAEIGDGVPEGIVYEFFVTTDADVLALNFVRTELLDGDFFNDALGTEGSAPNPAFIAVFPRLGADSYITTPGGTSVLGGGLPADGDDTFGDTEDNGPVSEFKFAQLTIPAGATGLFAGQFDIVGGSGVFSQNFEFPLGVPEPASLSLLGLAMVSFAGMRRRK